MIVSAGEWGSAPGRFAPELRHTPERLTVHHAGVATKPGEDYRDKMRRLQLWGQREKHWPDVPYHFLIAPDGTVFEGRPLGIAGATNTEYDTRGHALVQLFGDFEREEPTAAQLDAAVHVLAWLSTSLDIDPMSLRGHRDYAKTSCPGANLYRLLEDGSLLTRVIERIRGAR
ncbi:MAG: N-acetylmuramoyl-L-alanine amidase [Planctomycetes bacterium]|nr:N-acetylmuramoyl-L-alanine amidase [Planctomycetota bacterium]MCB9918529.1 N-acetylmuramoyl-L-alanine amidase [Planctomycetota bacterium]